jgi:hypothetical protein
MIKNFKTRFFIVVGKLLMRGWMIARSCNKIYMISYRFPSNPSGKGNHYAIGRYFRFVFQQI